MFLPRVLHQKLSRPPISLVTIPATVESQTPIEEARTPVHEESPRIFENTLHERPPADAERTPKRPRFTEPEISDDYLEQLVCGVELVFTDYAHQDEEGSSWLRKYSRTLDGQGGYIHLSVLLQNPNLVALKPVPTQPLLRRAIQSFPPESLETSQDGYLVRRRPSNYPLPFIPINVASKVNADGLSFWDERTIYVEPHTSTMCNKPAMVAWWLKKHGNLRPNWLPIQAMRRIAPSCALVVFSGSVMMSQSWEMFRKKCSPENWIMMTKREHIQRTEEYLSLLADRRIGSFEQDPYQQSHSSRTTPFPNDKAVNTNTNPHENLSSFVRLTHLRPNWLRKQDEAISELCAGTIIKALLSKVLPQSLSIEYINYKPGAAEAILQFSSVYNAETAAQILNKRAESLNMDTTTHSVLHSFIGHGSSVSVDEKGGHQSNLIVPDAKNTKRKRKRKRKAPKSDIPVLESNSQATNLGPVRAEILNRAQAKRYWETAPSKKLTEGTNMGHTSSSVWRGTKKKFAETGMIPLEYGEG